MFTATLIAEDLDIFGQVFHEVVHQFHVGYKGGKLRTYCQVDGEEAGDLTFDSKVDLGREDCLGIAESICGSAWGIARGGFGFELSPDVVVQSAYNREKRLLVADMDSTMITVECIDELADYAGLKAEVAAITERAMRGELDFEAALDARVRLLEGLPAETIDRCREERVRITPGARTLVQTMKARGATCILVSGGFTRFAEPVAEQIGFDRVVANVLEIEDGRLTGEVRRPIVGAMTKRDVLIDAAAELGIPIEETLAVGDGANDIPMLRAAGLGIAYRAKPAARAAADAVIDHNDLTALLYAQGIPRGEWVTD